MGFRVVDDALKVFNDIGQDLYDGVFNSDESLSTQPLIVSYLSEEGIETLNGQRQQTSTVAVDRDKTVVPHVNDK